MGALVSRTEVDGLRRAEPPLETVRQTAEIRPKTILPAVTACPARARTQFGLEFDSSPCLSASALCWPIFRQPGLTSKPMHQRGPKRPPSDCAVATSSHRQPAEARGHRFRTSAV